MSNNSSLNELLVAFSNEFSAVMRYFANAKYLKALGLDLLSKKIEDNYSDECGHLSILADRIVALKGQIPIASISVPVINSIDDVKQMFVDDLAIESDVIKSLTSSIASLERDGDIYSAELLCDILRSEVEHMNWISGQLKLIDLVGMVVYLSKNG